MTKCLRPDCPNEVVQTGKKPKKYCSSNCKQIVWQRSKKGKEVAESSLKTTLGVAHYLDPVTLPEKYKEGGLYMFENGVFTLMDEYVKSVGKTKRIALDSHPLPLNKEDEKQKVEYKAPDIAAYDGEKVTKAVIDEFGQWKEPTPPIPVREKGEDAIDFGARKSEWKRKYGSNH